MKGDRRTQRNPDRTREALLMAAFAEIHRSGFQAVSLDQILATAGVTKGALYHHFPNKAALGYAVVDEVIKPFILDLWVRPVEGADDPIDSLQRNLAQFLESIEPSDLALGCPLNNLIQEMSSVDEEFRARLNAVMEGWQDGFARALARGQEVGTVRHDIDPVKTAGFLVAAGEGIFGTAKNSQSLRLMESNLEVLSGYLEGLRPVPDSSASSAPVESASVEPAA